MKTNGVSLRNALIASTLLILAATGFSQNLVVNGSFEMPPVTNATKVAFPTSLSPWQTTSPTFEIWTNGWNNPSAGIGSQLSADGHQNLEILSEGTNVTVWQTVPTIVGELYVFSFYYSPRPKSASDLFTVSINSNSVFSAVEDGSGLASFDWHQFTTSFVAQNNFTTLIFSDQSLTDGGSGTHIDGVVLEHQPGLSISPNGAGLRISWLGATNVTYQLQFRTNLLAGDWIDFGSPVPGSNSTSSIFVTPSPGVPLGFYRLEVEP